MERIQYRFQRFLMLVALVVCGVTIVSAQTKVTDASQLKVGDVAIISEGSGEQPIQEEKSIDYNGISYLLYMRSKTAKVIGKGNNGYSGDIVIPQNVPYEGNEYTVTALDTVCFSGCTSLTNVTLPEGITSLGSSCFSGCSGLTSINLPESITSLGSYCFFRCRGLTSINLPEGITSLDPGCFNGCRGLTSITLSEGLTSLGSSCFKDCKGLTSINLPESITSLEGNCFMGCSGLTSINLPESITSLGSYCFSGCRGLTSINLPEGITSLGDFCFNGCSGLKQITLPSTLQTINTRVLRGVTNEIVMCCSASNPPQNRYDDFIGSNIRLYVPEESLEKYKSTSPWNKAYCINPLYPSTSIVVPAEASVVRTKTTKLEYTLLPENAGTKTVTWTSENPDIASVDAEGVVTGKSIGTTQIIATTMDGTDISDTTTVTVLPLPIESMTFAESAVSVIKNQSTTIVLTVNPEEADNKNVTWTSSDESIATIVQSTDADKPFEAIVTGLKVGKATIKAEAQDGSGISATCEVEVAPLQVSDITTQTTSVVKTIPTKMEMTITPAEADNQELAWTSLTPEIATVTEDGTVTGLVMGTATLEATTTDGSNISKKFEIEVTGLPVSSISMSEEASMVKTENMKLEYSILPLASDNQTLKWSSDAPTVASVDETSGVITANSVGDAVITATATDGSGISASTTIHVTPLKVSQLSVDKEISVLCNMTEKINTNIGPELADNQTLKWTSDDEDIATVTQDGVVTGVKAGTTIITATTTDGSDLSANCVVTVTSPTGIGYISMGEVKIVINKRHLKVEGLADEDVIQVVNTIGYTIYKGTQHELDLDAPGIYVIQAKGKTMKLRVL